MIKLLLSIPSFTVYQTFYSKLPSANRKLVFTDNVYSHYARYENRPSELLQALRVRLSQTHFNLSIENTKFDSGISVLLHISLFGMLEYTFYTN